MKNAGTNRVTIQSVMGTSEFRDGVDDFRAGRPMRDDWSGRKRSHIAKQQWDYERGRLWAAWCKSQGADMPLKIGRKVTASAIQAYKDGAKAGVFI